MEEILKDIKPFWGGSKTALFMETGHGYSSRLEVHFNSEHPYQMVEWEEVLELLATGRFRIATPQEVKAFYGF